MGGIQSSPTSRKSSVRKPKEKLFRLPICNTRRVRGCGHTSDCKKKKGEGLPLDSRKCGVIRIPAPPLWSSAKHGLVAWTLSPTVTHGQKGRVMGKVDCGGGQYPSPPPMLLRFFAEKVRPLFLACERTLSPSAFEQPRGNPWGLPEQRPQGGEADQSS